jgi:hypothetical protein
LSQIKLYLDEDAFARRLVRFVPRGIDVLSARDAKLINRALRSI